MKPFSESFMRHAAVTSSQYDETCRTMAHMWIDAESERVRLTKLLDEFARFCGETGWTNLAEEVTRRAAKPGVTTALSVAGPPPTASLTDAQLAEMPCEFGAGQCRPCQARARLAAHRSKL